MWKNKTALKILQHWRLIVPMLLAILVAACGGLTRSDKPPSSAWLLKPYQSSAAAPAPDSKTPVAVLISVAPGLDTDWILTLSADGEFNHFTGARWVDNLPEVITSLTSETLELSGYFKVISDGGGGGHEECILSLDVLEFYAGINSAEQTTDIKFVIHGDYECESSEPLIIHLGEVVPVHHEELSEIVAAFQVAVDQVMSDLLVLLQ